MALLESKPMTGIYVWTISSLFRVFTAVVVITGLLVLSALQLGTLLFAVITALLLFALGFAAYRVRRSDVALEHPGIDRFFQQVPCYLSIQDRDLRIVRSNKLFRRDFGDRIGEKCYKVYKGTDEICPNCPVIKTFEDGRTHTTEETVVTQNGNKAHMIVYTTPIKDDQGDIAGVMEMSTNITEVKKLQSEIEASRKEFRDLFENVPCYISIQDRDLRIIRANRQFRREFGDRVGDCCYEVFKNRDTICTDCRLKKTFEDGEIHSGETTVMKKDGSSAQLICYSAPIYNEDGKMAAVMEMSTDITEVKRLQRELTYMGKTIAFMAHRIKNILMGLEGGIFVVNTGMEDGEDKLVQQGWGMIQRNVENVSRIVKDLLYCSKEREMEYKKIDPTPVIRSCYELFSGRAQKEGIELHLELPESMPEGRFDKDALHNLITNLIINAFEAFLGDDSGSEKKRFIAVRGRYDSSAKHIFEVEDNGPGIPGQVGETVFEDFFSTKGREGTGLGLLVAQKVVEEHGGRITFRSEEGQGTIFKAEFPTHI
ncbi:MAG: PAS domain-containing protein [candidate division Zixibacteria bacterium]|nr:PAS domain-containing protein [candidate division Zixibacteria bacterium]